MMSPMQKLDEFVITQLEEFKDSNAFTQIQETYATLEEWQQDAVKFGMMVLSLLIPFILIFISYLFYSSASSELNLHETIIKEANQIIASRTDLRKKAGVLNPTPVGDRTALERMISGLGLSTSKLRVDTNSFDEIIGNGVSETRATIEFKDMSNEDLNNTFKTLSFRGKFKFREILITKNEKTQLLEGSFGISLFSQLQDNSAGAAAEDY
ncbi:MAG: hypothetical protein CME65_00445 [Halobacteriovoraceae bacterium]|nr:hypothetical protein [Halobacteriovoraceae bacterium]|tara:strand:+ start:8194 stop:8826 length:633 start_codon:yes stop_codon:yes gene_type:complete